MKVLENSGWLTAYIISNLVGLIFLFAAIKKPYLARLLFVLLFGWAAVFNFWLCHERPQEYLTYAEASLPLYRDFILGWFSRHVTEMVSMIAIGEALIAIGMLLRSWWVKLACIGVIIFQLAIAPLGVYAAFPFSLTVALAALFIYRNKNCKNYLWRFNIPEKKILQY